MTAIIPGTRSRGAGPGNSSRQHSVSRVGIVQIVMQAAAKIAVGIVVRGTVGQPR
ncbi:MULTISPECIES: hypothetical protein [Protofrankia]|uniref:hypothetical protein n=1 Tax=Protofrankia TaxID=2994361 RepID=UPI000A762D1C|nr:MULTISPECIES: hypothetical protein [Protofrankia]